MSDLSINPDSQAGLQAEDHILEYLAKRFDREERDWVLIHSVCSNSDSLDSVKRLPNVLTWIETGRYIPYDSQIEKIANVYRRHGWKGTTDELLEEVACTTSDRTNEVI